MTSLSHIHRQFVSSGHIRRGERGVALITALLVVALATVAAVTVASRQELDIRRTSNLLAADQAYAYALGVETWVQVILERDAEESEIDHLGEDWASIIPPIAVEGGQLVGRIEDLQGRFNLNNLIENGEPSNPHVKQFERLLDALSLDQELATALLDWMDENIESRFPDGAEDDDYLNGEPAYRAANQNLVSISELRLVKGFDAAAVNKLTPHVAVIGTRTSINVNTATIPVLQSLADDLSATDAESITEDRAEEGFTGLEEFLQHPALAGREVDQSMLTLDSSYFLLHGEIEIGNARTRIFSAIHRAEQGSEVLIRTRGTE